MHGKEQGALLGAMLQEPAARDEGLRRQFAKARIPVRGVNLQRMMQSVAAEQRALSRSCSLRTTWPGVWPGAGSTNIASSIACVPSSSTACRPRSPAARCRDRRCRAAGRRPPRGCDADRRIRPRNGRTDTWRSERSGPSGRHAASCSIRRDRRADGCRARCRCPQARRRPHAGARDTASRAGGSAPAPAAPCGCRRSSPAGSCGDRCG